MIDQGATSVLLMGGSAGSLPVLMDLFAAFPATSQAAVVLCLHTASRDSANLCSVLGDRSVMPVREATEHAPVAPGTIHVASGDYHLLIEQDKTFALSYDDPVHYSRPSIDVLFESAAEAFRDNALGVLLSGANQDGAAGLARIQALGGTVVVQTPASAQAPQMPSAALAVLTPDMAESPCELARYLRAWLISEGAQE